MLGVVLWSDSTENKAVIWCEDHGELAYFNGECGTVLEGTGLDAGDLVQFDMELKSELRLARHMRCVEQGAYAGLHEGLVRAQTSKPKEPEKRKRAKVWGVDIIPFMRRREAFLSRQKLWA